MRHLFRFVFSPFRQNFRPFLSWLFYRSPVCRIRSPSPDSFRTTVRYLSTDFTERLYVLCFHCIRISEYQEARFRALPRHSTLRTISLITELLSDLFSQQQVAHSVGLCPVDRRCLQAAGGV